MREGYMIKADFYADWISCLMQELAIMGYAVKESETPEEISLKFFNFLHRRISVKPRKILFSESFSCPLEHQAGLDILIDLSRNR